MAIVVFASEYRPAINSVHQKHADKCFSRVGISRVGNYESHYNKESRGYLPFVENDTFRTRVIPCYFSAYIAVLSNGDENNFGPLRFQEERENQFNLDGINLNIKSKSDSSRKFWVPVHKLFAGEECIRGMDLNPIISATHINEKLRKVHKALSSLVNVV